MFTYHYTTGARGVKAVAAERLIKLYNCVPRDFVREIGFWLGGGKMYH